MGAGWCKERRVKDGSCAKEIQWTLKWKRQFILLWHATNPYWQNQNMDFSQLFYISGWMAAAQTLMSQCWIIKNNPIVNSQCLLWTFWRCGNNHFSTWIESPVNQLIANSVWAVEGAAVLRGKPLHAGNSTQGGTNWDLNLKPAGFPGQSSLIIINQSATNWKVYGFTSLFFGKRWHVLIKG